MEREKVIKKVILTVASYNKKKDSFKKVLNDPVTTKAVEVFDEDISELIDSMLDLLGLPPEGEDDSTYERKDWHRDVCANLIDQAASNEKYIDPAVEMISDWENLNECTEKVESHSWFYYKGLLDAHLTGYKKWHEEQRELEKNKKKTS
ncbi:hypothetical protein [Guptibacillus sedimenti]|uniref:hypothetical protein n=1 Tax=Guptibacillus sedimenti TaxID=3025680 RepID=UPI00235FD8A3|nr:hypothetical protein [Pseudalkalibacillus sedimenti]